MLQRVAITEHLRKLIKKHKTLEREWKTIRSVLLCDSEKQYSINLMNVCNCERKQ